MLALRRERSREELEKHLQAELGNAGRRLPYLRKH